MINRNELEDLFRENEISILEEKGYLYKVAEELNRINAEDEYYFEHIEASQYSSQYIISKLESNHQDFIHVNGIISEADIKALREAGYEIGPHDSYAGLAYGEDPFDSFHDENRRVIFTGERRNEAGSYTVKKIH